MEDGRAHMIAFRLDAAFVDLSLASGVLRAGPVRLNDGGTVLSGDARIDLSEIDWVKRAGQTARATLNYRGDLREQAAALRFTTEDASLEGDLRLGSDGRLQSLDLQRFLIQDQRFKLVELEE